MADHQRQTLDDLFCGHRLPLLRTIARLVGNPAVAEDLVQETYLRVRRAARRQRIDHMQPFLYQTARNLALDHLRAERRRDAVVDRRGPEGGVDEIASAVPSQESAAGDQQLVERLEAALQRLPPRQRTVFLRAKLDGCTQDEIAAELGAAKSTVQKDLKAAMAACMEILQALRTD